MEFLVALGQLQGLGIEDLEFLFEPDGEVRRGLEDLVRRIMN
jgi:hypothetical protein